MNNAPSTRRLDIRDAALWVTAVALFALVLIVAGRGPIFAEPALALSNDRAGDMAVITVDDGSDHDVIIVVDRVKGMALVYSMLNRQSLELHQADPVDRLISQARAHAANPRPSP